MASLVDLYPYRMQDEPEFLLLKRAPEKLYSGQWRMIGGKVENCEAAWQSGLRELREETGLFPKLYWSVPSINQFYEPATDQLHHIPVFAAEVSVNNSIHLNEEHTEWRWFKINETEGIINWPEQQRLLSLINQILTSQQIVDEWKIPL